MLLVLLWHIPAAYALDPFRPFGQYAHERWLVSDGLPFPGGSDLAQDRQGALWVGSISGLARFDGGRFTVYDAENTPELGGSVVYGIRSDRQGRLWIGSDNGVVLREHGRFVQVPALRGRVARVLGLDSDGLMLVSDLDAVLGLDADMQVRVRYEVPGVAAAARRGDELWLATDRPVVRVVGDQVTEMLLPGMGEGYVEQLLEVDGKLLAATTGGLYLHDGQAWHRHPDPRLQRPVLSLLSDRDRNLWVSTELSLFRMRDNRIAEEVVHGVGSRARRLFEDRDGSLWIATQSTGVHRVWNGVGTLAPLHVPPAMAHFMWAVVPWGDGVMTGGTYGLATARDGRMEPVPAANSCRWCTA